MKYLLSALVCFSSFFCSAQQYVGIGTPAPQAPLHVVAGTGTEVLRLQATEPALTLSDAANNTKGQLSFTGTSIQLNAATGANIPVNISSGSTINASFDPNGNVGIGLTGPTQKLQVAGNIESSDAVIAKSHRFAAPKTYRYVVSGGDIVNRSTTATINRNHAGMGNTGATGSGSLTAALHLPDDATIAKMTVHFWDRDPNGDLTVNLVRNFAGASAPVVIIGGITSSGSSGDGILTDDTILVPLVNNAAHTYSLEISNSLNLWNNSNFAIKKVIIEYTVLNL